MSIAISILAIGLLIALHELGHLAAARAMGMKVLRYSIGLLHPIATWTSKRSGTVYQLGVLPLGGFVQIKGMNPYEDGAYTDTDSYMAKPAWRRLVVLVAGPLANLATAVALLFGLYLVGNEEATDEPRIGLVAPSSPAEAAGLLRNDTVVSLEGEAVETWVALAAALRARPDKPTTLVIRRGTNELTLKVTPKNKDGVGLIGIGPGTELVKLPVAQAAARSVVRCAQLSIGTLVGMYQLATGQAKGVETSGIVGIVDMARSSLDLGVGRFLDFVAYLSVLLFLFNLLPLPALDGGRGTFLLFEIVTRRRVPAKLDTAVNTVGFFLLIALMLLLTGKDIVRLIAR